MQKDIQWKVESLSHPKPPPSSQGDLSNHYLSTLKEVSMNILTKTRAPMHIYYLLKPQVVACYKRCSMPHEVLIASLDTASKSTYYNATDFYAFTY